MQLTATGKMLPFTKLLLVMRMTAFLLISAIIQVSANIPASAQVTIREKSAPLEKVLKAIKKQSAYDLFFDEILVKSKGKPVAVSLNNVSVEEALTQVFKTQDHLTFTLTGKIISVLEKKSLPPDEGPEQVSSAAAGLIITVVNPDNQPLEGAFVVIKGKNKGYTTDRNGQVNIKSVTPDAVLVISFTGYKFQEYKVSTNPAFNPVLIRLAVSTNQLDELQVGAYSITSKRLQTGNITTVKGEDIAKQPVMNPMLALVGRVAGLDVTQMSGLTSGRVKMEIRGRNTVNPAFTADPLYIVDGVPLTILELNGDANNYQNGSSGFMQGQVYAAGGAQSPFFNMNPSDIESIEVLKDADATAIYGSRGANGVIIITTKRGKPGKTKLDINIRQGVTAVTRHWDMLNTQEYLALRREAFRNDGIIPDASNAPDMFSFDTTRYQDWQKALWGNLGKATHVNMVVLGGNETTTFRLGGNYRRQTEIMTVSGSNQEGGMSLSLDHRTMDGRFSISFTGKYSYSAINTVNITGAPTLAPNTPDIFDEKGDLNYAAWNAAGLTFSNEYPFMSLKRTFESKTSFLTSNLKLNAKLFKGITFSINAGYNHALNGLTTLLPIAAQNPLMAPMGMGNYGSNRNTNWIIEPQIHYNTYIGDGKLAVFAGASKQSASTNALSHVGFGFTNDAFLQSFTNAPFQMSTEADGKFTYAAVFASIKYNWKDKYVINLNARRDGSSRFGPGKQYGNFGSAGIIWIASEEGWMKKSLPSFVSFLKFRGSYGITGGDAVKDYQYLSQWNNQLQGRSLYSYNGITPLVNQHAVNQDYHWQRNKKLEAAISIGLLQDNKINLDLSYYQNRCDDQLMEVFMPYYTGFNSVLANWPAMVQNNGWEFSLNATPFKSNKFSWSVYFNISANKNKLLSYPDIENSAYFNMYKVGQSLNNIYVLHNTGVDPQTGQFTFADQNKDGITRIDYLTEAGTGVDDRIIALDLNPVFFGGLFNQIRYGNWNLSFHLSFKKQVAANEMSGTQDIGQMRNVSREYYNNRWTKPGDIAKYARASTTSPADWSNYMNSDGVYSDASFIRLSSLAVSYTIPSVVVKKAGMSACSLFLNTQNLFILTRYRGIDPETHLFGELPPPKIITGGISVQF